MKLALYQPEIPQNTGTLMRLCACFGIAIDLIEPCGFHFSDRTLKRSGMDYLQHINYFRHPSWDRFFEQRKKENHRIILMTPHTDHTYLDHHFTESDILLLGRESDGVPSSVAQAVDAKIKIPMKPQMRSINLALSGAIVLAEAMRQTNLFPQS